jgi:hypothetical protein
VVFSALLETLLAEDSVRISQRCVHTRRVYTHSS